MKKFYSHFVSKQVLIVLLGCICVEKLWATNVSGNVSGVWSKANSPYIITATATVPSGPVPVNISVRRPFVIYPNPVKDVLYVQVQRSNAEKVSLQITDMQGKIITQQDKQLTAGVNALPVSTISLAKSSYFIVIKGQTTEKKIFIKE